MKTITKGVMVLMLGMWLMSCQESGAPNKIVSKAFSEKFGTVRDVKWSHNPDFSYAHFKQNGKSVIAVFGNDGQFMDTDPAKPIQ